MGQGFEVFHTLTPDEKQSLATSWMKIAKDIDRYGTCLFMVLFKDFPNIANYFPYEGPNDENFFKGHTINFMKELDQIMLNIEKPDRLLRMLMAHVFYHIPRNICSEDYSRMRKSLLKMLEQEIGVHKYRKDFADAWDKFLRILFGLIVDTTHAEKIKLLQGEKEPK